MRVENANSKTLKVKSGVLLSSLLGPWLFFFFIIDLHKELKFGSQFIFADNLNVVAIAKTPEVVQEEVLAIELWVKNNKMELAVEKFAQIIFRGSQVDHPRGVEKLNSPHENKDLGIMVFTTLSGSAHVNTRLKKTNRVLYTIRRNLACIVKIFVTQGLYISLNLPFLLYRMNCVKLTKTDLQNIARKSYQIDNRPI